LLYTADMKCEHVRHSVVCVLIVVLVGMGAGCSTSKKQAQNNIVRDPNFKGFYCQECMQGIVIEE